MSGISKRFVGGVKKLMGVESSRADKFQEPEVKNTDAHLHEHGDHERDTTITHANSRSKTAMTLTRLSGDAPEQKNSAGDCGDSYAFCGAAAARDSVTAEKNRHAQRVLNALAEGFAMKPIDSIRMSGDQSETIRVQAEGVEPVPVRSLKLVESWSTNFLERINILRLEDSKIEVCLINTGGTIASTGGNRHKRNIDAGKNTPRVYDLLQVNFDSQLSYDTLSGASGASDDVLVSRYLEAIERRKMLDVIMTGFSGTHHALMSNPATYPNREDCGRGWLQAIREEAAHRVYSGMSVSSFDQTGQIISVGDYASVDALVMDALNTAIDEHFRRDLVAVCSSKLLNVKNHRLLNNLSGSNAPNSEILMHDEIRANPSLGGVPAVCVPFFPDDAVLVTPLANLSWYWQKGSWRKHFKNEPEFNRMAFYESVKACYVVEEYDRTCLIEAIKLL